MFNTITDSQCVFSIFNNSFANCQTRDLEGQI